MTITKDHLSAINTAKAYKMHYKREKKEKTAVLATKSALSAELIREQASLMATRESLDNAIRANIRLRRNQAELLFDKAMLKAMCLFLGIAFVVILVLGITALNQKIANGRNAPAVRSR